MRTAEPRWAAILAGGLRPLAIVLGATFAVHRLTLRLAAELEVSQPDIAIEDRSYPTRLIASLSPSDAVVEALGRTTVLAAAAAIAGLAIAWSATTIRRRRGDRKRRADRPISGLLTGLVLAIAVPGVIWIPLHRLAADAGLVPDRPPVEPGFGPDTIRSTALWALLIGLAAAPTIAAAISGGRPWTAGRAGGHPALAPLAARPSSEPRWRFGFPTLTFGITLALAEVISNNGGLFDGVVSALRENRLDDLFDLATFVILGSALLAPLADLGSRVLRRVERPRAPGFDRGEPGWRPTAIALGLGALVAGVAAVGFWTERSGDGLDRALAGPRFGGPWLGTDAVGRSLAIESAQALGTTLAASAIPAATATLVGAGLAFFRRSRGTATDTLFGGLLDVLSWPPAVVVPLAAWPVVAGEDSALDPVALQITALILVPMATRLLVTPAARSSQRLAKLAATMAVMTAGALAIQVFTGFVVGGVVDPGDRPGLGQLLGAGLATYDVSSWPVLIPLLAATGAGAALYCLAEALTGVGHKAVSPAPGSAPGRAVTDARQVVLATGPGAVDAVTVPAGTEQAPVGRVLTRGNKPVVAPPGPVVSLDAAQPQVEQKPPEIAEPDDGHERGTDATEEDAFDPGDDEVITLPVEETPVLQLDDAAHETPAPQVDSVLHETPAPQAGESAADGLSIEDEATQTIELRPSDLRRAKIAPSDP